MAGNAREIRARIKSIKNTEKITRAMQMVAAAKVRRARERVEAAQPFAEAIADVFRQVASQVPTGEYRSPLLESRPVKRVALVVITSDRGLCGGYNANVIRQAVNRHRHWRTEGAEVKLIIVGTKGVQFFRHSNFDVVARYQQLPQIPTFAEAGEVANTARKLFEENQVDLVELIYTNFRSMVSLVPTTAVLVPATVPSGGNAAEGDAVGKAGATPKGVSAQYIFEPSPDVVMDAIIPKYLETVVYQALLESAASELAAKMTAMSAASKNAKELAAALSLVYNKARQASITQEILEVVGGASAL